jgi:hypothetical protein
MQPSSLKPPTNIVAWKNAAEIHRPALIQFGEASSDRH